MSIGWNAVLPVREWLSWLGHQNVSSVSLVRAISAVRIRADRVCRQVDLSDKALDDFRGV